MRVGIVDYGVGNLGSVVKAIENLRVSAALVATPGDLASANCIILPGVGNFGDCAVRLAKDGWIEAIRDQVLGYDKPILGVCLGMQLLASFGEEHASDMAAGENPRGLDLIGGYVRHVRNLGCKLRVPHVGWNAVNRTSGKAALLDGIPDDTDFYFVHSYAFVATEASESVAVTTYDITFTSVVGKGRIWGTQFHPEKSSVAGARVLRNFLDGASC
jgi:glutamine amidotransferase